jgi:hypothetical protein
MWVVCSYSKIKVSSLSSERMHWNGDPTVVYQGVKGGKRDEKVGKKVAGRNGGTLEWSVVH